MILLVAATTMEATPLANLCQGHDLLVAGVGVLETTLHLTRRLAVDPGRYSLVVNFGVAGAYPASGTKLLEICLADREVLADLGICRGEEVDPLNVSLTGPLFFPLNDHVTVQAGNILNQHNFANRIGTFITVSAVSATRRRGDWLCRTHHALCENMEGAAVARVCQEFGLPCIEVRCISNMVEDRDAAAWQLAPAIHRCAEAVTLLVNELSAAMPV